jgi:hypothetical protein
VLNWPEGHSVQAVCVVAVPGAVVVMPAGQMMNAAQTALFSTELKLPAAQAAQVRSVRVVPSAVTEVPTTQVVLRIHGVAGLLSSSQVPAAQGDGNGGTADTGAAGAASGASGRGRLGAGRRRSVIGQIATCHDHCRVRSR